MASLLSPAVGAGYPLGILGFFHVASHSQKARLTSSHHCGLGVPKQKSESPTCKVS